MIEERQQATYKEKKYPPLNLACTYAQLVEWIRQEYPLAVLFKADGNAFDVYLPSEEFRNQAKRIFPAFEVEKSVQLSLTSFIRFEILSDNPLILEGVHYHVIENSPEIEKFKSFVTW